MSRTRSVDRRSFLKGTAVTGAAALVPDAVAQAAQAPAAPRAAAARTPAATAAREADPPVEVEAITTDRPGGDFMVDVLKSLELRLHGVESRDPASAASTSRSSTTAATRSRSS